MTAPTINGTRYPQPVEELLRPALELAIELGEVPSRNRLMREFRIGAPKADELRTRLLAVAAPAAAEPVAVSFDYSEPIGPDLAPSAPVPGSEPAEVEPVDDDQAGAEQPVDPWEYATAEPVEQAPDTRARTTPPGSPKAAAPAPAVEQVEQVTTVGHPGSNITTTPTSEAPRSVRPVRTWPVLLLALPAFVAIWSGWVGLGGLTGFGVVHPLPGIWDSLSVNTAITLPIGVETYAAYALRAWLSGQVPAPARRFAKWSAIGSLLLGALGQVAYHLMESVGMTAAPWWITTLVACLPVVVLGMGAALAHLMRHDS
ncbi:ABC transporter permease [Micromonospora sp. CPCC 206060]|uniref:ABC transporter permease n=1 Tax=Micromonospora sp. CPCC 206060 TaxID=3122406 RepID=UPI002FF0907F